jgi:NADH:ubiquinone oxidoreductase subunit
LPLNCAALGVAVASGIAIARAATAPMIFNFITLSISARSFNRTRPVWFHFGRTTLRGNRCTADERIAPNWRQAGLSQKGERTCGELDIQVVRWHQAVQCETDAMKQFLLKFFTWWNSQTFGTQLWTWRFGELVGEDAEGNRYYRTRGGKIDPTLDFERRWVVYNGYAEASRVGPDWHGWLHHTVDVPPTKENYQPREWQKPHQPNLTGTPLAYRPTGSTLASGRRPKATGDYQAWTPGQ